jgi:hypothetical protein
MTGTFLHGAEIFPDGGLQTDQKAAAFVENESGIPGISIAQARADVSPHQTAFHRRRVR